MKQILILLIVLISCHAIAQPCTYKLSGALHCHDKYCTQLSGVEILIRETAQQTFTDDKGIFNIVNVCAGTYHLHIHGIGFQIIDTCIFVNHDTHLLIELSAASHALKSVTVTTTRSRSNFMNSAAQTGLSSEQLKQLRGLSISEAMQSLSGVSVLRSGPDISKPVIHGMHSNRVLMLNNGARLEGQNWGSEHAPEIDINTAGSVEVIKGSASLRYGSDAIAGVIEVLPPPFDSSKTWNGFVSTHVFSNGLGNASSASIDYFKKIKQVSNGLRVQASWMKHGSLTAPQYILGNTASRQLNTSLLYQINHKKKQAELMYSRFESKPGILAYSHIGNLNDLNDALQQNKPYTTYPFTYIIDRPKQLAIHETIQGKITIDINERNKLLLQYTHQNNNRKEYDLLKPYNRENAEKNIADFNFILITDQAQLNWKRKKNNSTTEGGLSLGTQGQGFRGTGYRSLVPNFRSYDGGAFLIHSVTRNNLSIDAGLRYDLKNITTYQRNPRSLQIDIRELNFNAWSFNLGGKLIIQEHLVVRSNIGRSWRAPQVIELFAKGIHQGTASYELGDSTLRTEESLCSTFDINFDQHIFHVHSTLYYHYIQNYIYLKPALYAVQLIQGAFPVFEYHQTDMSFSGVDMDASMDWSKSLSSHHQISIVYARDVINNQYIPGIVPNRFTQNIDLTLFSNNTSKMKFSIQNETVLKQNRVEVNSDYADPPPAYSLWNMHIEFHLKSEKQKTWYLQLGSTNVLNTSYRNYMNLFRYFSDEVGRNIFIRAQYNF